MKANELRIGNWLYCTDTKENFEINTFGLLGLFEGKRESYQSIPLSVSVLGACGFVNNRRGEPSIEINDIASHLELMEGKDNYFYPSFTQTPQGDEERTVYFNRINAVHQLQNLYYALTQTELQINL